MKHELMRRHLRFATSPAYDHCYAGSGTQVLERSVEEYPLDEPIVASHGMEAGADALPPPYAPACPNPLQDEPTVIATVTVKRFGVVGLVAYALGSAVLRYWNHRRH